MRSTMLTMTAAFLGIMCYALVANACSSVQSGAVLELFECEQCGGTGGATLQANILTVSGSLVLSNRRATPELASLVVELEAKVGRKWTTVARRVLNEAGDDVVENCEGLFASDAMPGRLVLVDADGSVIPFASVKDLSEGLTALHYVASFGDVIPGVAPGSKVRVRALATAIGADGSRTCELDADNDGATDFSVKTNAVRSTVRVPVTTLALIP